MHFSVDIPHDLNDLRPFSLRDKDQYWELNYRHTNLTNMNNTHVMAELTSLQGHKVSARHENESMLRTLYDVCCYVHKVGSWTLQKKRANKSWETDVSSLELIFKTHGTIRFFYETKNSRCTYVLSCSGNSVWFTHNQLGLFT